MIVVCNSQVDTFRDVTVAWSEGEAIIEESSGDPPFKPYRIT